MKVQVLSGYNLYLEENRIKQLIFHPSREPIRPAISRRFNVRLGFSLISHLPIVLPQIPPWVLQAHHLFDKIGIEKFLKWSWSDHLAQKNWDKTVEIMQVYPGQRAILASGFSETDQVWTAMSLGKGTYVNKPYNIETLARTVKLELSKNTAKIL